MTNVDQIKVSDVTYDIGTKWDNVSDKPTVINDVSSASWEEWTFVLDDGTTVTKQIIVK